MPVPRWILGAGDIDRGCSEPGLDEVGLDEGVPGLEEGLTDGLDEGLGSLKGGWSVEGRTLEG